MAPPSGEGGQLPSERDQAPGEHSGDGHISSRRVREQLPRAAFLEKALAAPLTSPRPGSRGRTGELHFRRDRTGSMAPLGPGCPWSCSSGCPCSHLTQPHVPRAMGALWHHQTDEENKTGAPFQSSTLPSSLSSPLHSPLPQSPPLHPARPHPVTISSDSDPGVNQV